MNRDQFIRKLQKCCRKRDLGFNVDKESGKGSHYLVRVGGKFSTVQKDVNPSRIDRVLKQLDIDKKEFYS